MDTVGAGQVASRARLKPMHVVLECPLTACHEVLRRNVGEHALKIVRRSDPVFEVALVHHRVPHIL